MEQNKELCMKVTRDVRLQCIQCIGTILLIMKNNVVSYPEPLLAVLLCFAAKSRDYSCAYLHQQYFQRPSTKSSLYCSSVA